MTLPVKMNVRSMECWARNQGVDLSIERVPEEGAIRVMCFVVSRSEYRGKGIGSRVMRSLQEEVTKEGNDIILTADGTAGGTTDDAVKFYKKNGFVQLTHKYKMRWYHDKSKS